MKDKMIGNIIEELSYTEMVMVNGGWNDPESPAGKFGAKLHEAWNNLKDEVAEAIETFKEGWNSVK